jgi:uracil-DNA glycosylase
MADPKSELLSLARSLRLRLQDETELPPPTLKSQPRPEPEEAPVPKTQAAPKAKAAPKGDAVAALAEIAGRVDACRACPLGSTRIKCVPGVGNPKAKVLFIGEGPGFDEDRKGEPFVGRSGQLLDKIMESIGLNRENSFIANIVKCHPMKDPATPEARGNDRPPSPEEMAACRGFLDEQIAVIKPDVIVTLGSVAAKGLIDPEIKISEIRGKWRSYTAIDGREIKLLPTYHPAALLRNPDLKKDVWTDMKNLKREIES